MNSGLTTKNFKSNKKKFSRKRLESIPVEQNTPQLIERRIMFAQHVSRIADSDLIYLDESGFNAHTSRHYGYSPINNKAIKNVTASKGKNTSLLCMITNQGCMAYHIVNGAVNAEILKTFLSENFPNYTSGRGRKTLILDNVRFHHNAEVKDICQNNGINN